MQRVSYDKPGQRAHVIGPYKAPVARVKSGETFVVETLDAFGNMATSADVDIKKVADQWGPNPCTGPIYVEGAEPGDALAVTIDAIKLTRDFGVSAILPRFGGLTSTALTPTLDGPLPQRVMLHPIKGGEIVFDPKLKIAPIPVEAFYGTIGTSPAAEAISTISPGFHGGNMDSPDVCVGNTIYLPVQAPGALLYIGDCHAAQGDGEVCGVAVEVPSEGTLTARVVKGRRLTTPRIENDEYIMSVGSARPLDEAARIAYCDLLDWVERDYKLDRLTAYELASLVAKVRLANMVDTLYTMVAKFPKRYLPAKR